MVLYTVETFVDHPAHGTCSTPVSCERSPVGTPPRISNSILISIPFHDTLLSFSGNLVEIRFYPDLSIGASQNHSPCTLVPV